MNVEDYMARAPTFAVYDGFCKTKSVMDQHSRILVSVSGGSDSDDMVDVVEHMRTVHQMEERTRSRKGVQQAICADRCNELDA